MRLSHNVRVVVLLYSVHVPVVVFPSYLKYRNTLNQMCDTLAEITFLLSTLLSTEMQALHKWPNFFAKEQTH